MNRKKDSNAHEIKFLNEISNCKNLFTIHVSLHIFPANLSRKRWCSLFSLIYNDGKEIFEKKKTWNLISLRKKMLAIIFRNVLQSVFWECIWFSLAAENGISFPSWKFHVQLHGNQLISIIFALQRRILQWKNFQMSSYRRQCVMISWFGMTCHRTIWYRTKVCILFDFVQN